MSTFALIPGPGERRRPRRPAATWPCCLSGLAYPKDTTTIRWRPDGLTATSGAFIEAAEHLTAYYVVECATPQRARAIAERVLDFEVRLIHDSFGMGDA